MEFKNYLLNEQNEYLNHKVADVLTSVHELLQGGKQVGTRKLLDDSELIVGQIRTILHSTWPHSSDGVLRALQRVGVAIAKCCNEKGDINEILNSARVELEKITKKLGTPVNHLGTKTNEPL